MPAYRQRVYLCPEQNGQPVWVGDFPVWWDRSEFFKKYGDRGLDTGNPIYVDYGILLTPGEAYSWDRQSRETFAQNPLIKKDAVVKAMRQWDAVLKTARWVIVESYEWESGMD